MGTASNPSSPSSSPQPPFVTSPGRIFGSSNPGGPMSPSTSLTPFSGSPGKIKWVLSNVKITLCCLWYTNICHVYDQQSINIFRLQVPYYDRIRSFLIIFTASPCMSPTSLPALPFSGSSSAGFSASFIPPPPIFTSAFNSSLLSPHFPPLSLPGSGDFHGTKYEPKFETKFEPNLSARHGPLPSPPIVRTTQQPNSVTSSSDQLHGKVCKEILNRCSFTSIHYSYSTLALLKCD